MRKFLLAVIFWPAALMAHSQVYPHAHPHAHPTPTEDTIAMALWFTLLGGIALGSVVSLGISSALRKTKNGN